MNEKSQPLDDIDVQEELSAYLDGELSAEQRSAVEQRLASDPGYRSELGRLEKAWNLLDRLPQATVDESFTRTTLEMVAVAAAEELEPQAAARNARPAGPWVWAIAGLVAAVAVGYGLGRWWWIDPNAQLVDDLPILENLDLYHPPQGLSLEFLRQLGEQDFLKSSVSGERSLENSRPLTVEQREEKLSHLSPALQQRLRRNQRLWSTLAPEEQAEIRAVQGQVDGDAQAEQLRQTAARYREWLNTLSLEQQESLRKLAPEKRLAVIRAIKTPLGHEDLEKVGKWLEDLAWSNDNHQFPPQFTADEDLRRKIVLSRNWQQWRGSGLREQALKPDQLESLRAQLSAAARSQLSVAEDNATLERAVLQEWFGTAVQERTGDLQPGMRRLQLPKDLQEIFDRLPPERKRELEKLPEENLRRFLGRQLQFKEGRPRGHWPRRNGPAKGQEHPPEQAPDKPADAKT